MSDVDITIEICGMSGDGTISAGAILNQAMSNAGFSVMAFDSYPAEIRGFGRCVTRSRFGHEQMLAMSNETHVLISLDDEQSVARIPDLSENAIVIFDNKPFADVDEGRSIAAHVEADTILFGVPFVNLSMEVSGATKGKNLSALGGFAAVSGIDPEFFYEVIEKKFRSKGKTVSDANLKCFDAGYKYALNTFEGRLMNFLPAPGVHGDSSKKLLSGNEAIGKGALDAGLELYFGYPITPATPIMEFLAKHLPEKGGRVLQMEDEIASIGAVIGAFYAGKRAMTATSGPGLALMTEMISLGVMIENPAVIINAQRGGPSTGTPTKTEQSDLQAAVYGAPGDSPRFVLAPTNVSECYTITVKSFQLAEKYQTPVIVLTDFFLDNRVENVDTPHALENEIADSNVYPHESEKDPYKRFRITESGISPRAIPGMEGFIFPCTGLEHSENGNPDYTAPNHQRMSEKRHRKIKNGLCDLPEPKEFLSDNFLDIGVIAWGSTFGAALEATLKAKKKGIKAGCLKIITIYPCHEGLIRSFMQKCGEILVPELNFQGQLANLIGHLHHKEIIRLNEVTGIPLSAHRILAEIERIHGTGKEVIS